MKRLLIICMDVLGIKESELVTSTSRGSIKQLARLTIEAEETLVF